MSKESDIYTAPVVTYARHRIATDGNGVTTLVCFHGCPLRCKYCINPFSFSDGTKKTFLSPEELYEKVKIDELYFLATNGGVTFGGGEPLLYPDFIAHFRDLCGPDWRINVETSLNVPWDNVEKIICSVDHFIVDCKDTNPDIYKKYTGKDNALMLDNLKKLINLISPDKIVLRVPLIPDHNTEDDRTRSIELLTNIGVRHFDKFNYVIR